jgi:predicted RNase H-like nuclease (RuvC/YqgF family)
MKSQDNQRLQGVLGAREADLANAYNGIDKLTNREQRLTNEVELLRRENKLLEDKLLKMREDLHGTVHGMKGESYLLLENENLKEDVIRLIKMLQNTKEVLKWSFQV